MKNILGNSLFLIIGYWIYVLFKASFREKHFFINKAMKINENGKPIIFVVFHQNLVCGLMNCDIIKPLTLVSQHPDAELIAHTLKKRKHLVIRGSTKRSATQALLKMIEHLNQGHTVFNVVDGPVGPTKVAKMGVVQMVEKTNAKIIPIGCHIKSYIEINSWDKFHIPLPFSKMTSYFDTELDFENELKLLKKTKDKEEKNAIKEKIRLTVENAIKKADKEAKRIG